MSFVVHKHSLDRNWGEKQLESRKQTKKKCFMNTGLKKKKIENFNKSIGKLDINRK